AFRNGNSFATGQVTAFDCFPTTVTGVSTTNGDITLCADAGSLSLNQAVNAGSAMVRLKAGGTISATTAITAAALGVRSVSGDIDLDNVINAIATTLAAR